LKVLFWVLQVVQKAHNAFQSGRTRDIEFRRKALQQLLKMYEEHTAEMLDVLHKDLRKVSFCVFFLAIFY
jgi:acyl-CoA reductase-like NAD-dependent aldehyde dehydrogenase